MRACIQRVRSAEVRVHGEIVGKIGPGLLVFLGIRVDDTLQDIAYLASKISQLRILEDSAGKMNLSLLETGQAMLVVSQFTLLADCRKGRRPSFIDAAPPEKAEAYYLQFCAQVRSLGITVETGQFRAQMQVALVNDGPVTIVLDSQDRPGGSQPGPCHGTATDR